MILTEKQFFEFGRAAISFANLSAISCADDVEMLFPWIDRKTQTLSVDPNAVKTYTAERDLLRGRLDALVRQGGHPDEVEELRNSILRPAIGANERHSLKADLVFNDGGFALDIPHAGTRGVKTSWLLFIDAALTLQPNKRFLRSHRLTKCRWTDCPHPYLFDEREKITRPRWHCEPDVTEQGPSHKKRAEMEKRP